MKAFIEKNFFKKSDKPGIVDPNALKELTSGRKNDQKDNQESKEPTLIQLRDGMGWPAKDICKHELVIEDRIVKGHVPIKTYRKKSLLMKNIPAIIFFHGGGFFGGSIQNVEQICRTFADKGDVSVISVGYRLSPENPYPAGLLDCYNVVEYFAIHAAQEFIDSEKLFVSGDSAGGNLSICVSLLDCAHFKSSYIKKTLAYYPVVDITTAGQGAFWDTDQYFFSNQEEAKIVKSYIKKFAQQDTLIDEWYGGDINRHHSLLSPIFASKDEVALLPPLKIIIGEYDPLRLQVEAFIKHLEDCGVSTEYVIYNGMIHAFMDKIGCFMQAEEGIDDGIEFLLTDS